MKVNKKLAILMSVGFALSLPATAQTLTAGISFFGGFSPIPNDGVSMVSNLTTFDIDSSLSATGSSGDLAGLNGFFIYTASPFGLDTSGGPQHLYTVQGFDFFLTEVTAVNPIAPAVDPLNPSGITDEIGVIGNGYVTGPGYLPTAASFSFSAQASGPHDGNGGFLPGGTASWSSSMSMSGIAYVPEPSSAMMGVIGLLVTLRRRR
jgi:hypothetical protein